MSPIFPPYLHDNKPTSAALPQLDESTTKSEGRFSTTAEVKARLIHLYSTPKIVAI